jgi:hypothetical protein
MFGAFARSWQLGKQSLQVLHEDKRLVVFPLISAGSCLLVLASFALPLLLTVDFSTLNQKGPDKEVHVTPFYYAVVFAFYFVNYSVIAFFNAALIGCVMRKFDGQPSGVRDGLKIAASRLPQILGWACCG